MKKGEDNSSGVASVVLGILSISFSLIPLISLIIGIVGLVFGIVQSKSMKNKWSTSGIVLSIIGIILSIAIYFLVLSLASNPEFASQLAQLQGATP